MAGRDVTLTVKIVTLEQVKNQVPNISPCQLVETTGQLHALYSSKRNCEMDNRKLPKKWKCEGKDSDVEESLTQWFPVVTGQGVSVVHY